MNKNGKFGFVDREGKLIIPAGFVRIQLTANDVDPFSQGMIWVETDDPKKSGLIDVNGGWVVEDIEGHRLYAHASDSRIPVQRLKDRRWGYADLNGVIVIEPRFQYARPFMEKKALVYTANKDGATRWGVIDAEGQWLVRPVFEQVEKFCHGLAAARISTNDGARWGYINASGEWQIEPQFSRADDFKAERALVKLPNAKTVIIDLSGAQVAELEQHYVGQFGNGMLRVIDRKTRRMGYVDRSGILALPCQYGIADSFSEGVACVRLKGATGIIDKSGKILAKHSPGLGGFHSICKDGRIKFFHFSPREPKRYGYLNRDGKVVIPFRFAAAQDFRDGLAAVMLKKESNVWHYIDRAGKIVCEAGDISHSTLLGIKRQ